jgi:hypothetical protein
MMQLIGHIAELQAKLDGATALNIYLLHKLGGSITLDSQELQRVCTDFGVLNFAMKGEQINIRLCSGVVTPITKDNGADGTAPVKEAA